jgi:hypothetical protein
MPFANGAKAQDEPAAMVRCARLVGMPDNARIEQGRGLERIFAEKIGPNQATLRFIQLSMWLERVLHLGGARFKNVEQVPVTTCEVFEHLAQLLRGSFGIEPKHPVNDMIGPDFVGRVEIARLSRRFERPDDDPGWIRAQIEALAIHEFGLGQRCSLGAIELELCRCRWMTMLTRVSPGVLQPWP